MSRTAPLALVLALALALALAGCGSEVDPPGARGLEPGDPVTSPTAVPAADGPVQTTYAVTVLDDGGGAELCVGGVAESLPPQCGGPPITNWDWADHAGDFEDVSGTRWGDFHLVGTFDGERFTASEVTPADEFDAPEPPDDPPLGTPCDDVEVVDPGRTSMADFNAASGAANRLAGHGMTWVDTSGDPRTPEEIDQEMADGNDDVSSWVLNVSVTEDLDAAEAALREHWGGGLCVSEAPYTQAELRDIQREVNELPGMTSSGADGDHVFLGVVYDDGSLQAWLDEEYGEGLVRVSSALVPV